MNPCLPDGIKRVPRPVRDEARRILRHFPGVVDIATVGSVCPEVFDTDEAWRAAGDK